MTSVDAAYQVLREAGEPLHYKEIARRILASRLWTTTGKTPQNTINRDINQEIAHRGRKARFVRLGDGMYAAAPDHTAAPNESGMSLPSDVAYVADAWSRLPVEARQRVLLIVRAALSGKADELDDPVITVALPQGPKIFPRDFLSDEVGVVRHIKLPEEEIEVRRLPSGNHVVQSHFGFSYVVRNETEGRFIVYAHGRGVRDLALPEEMIHTFKAVKGYESYLRDLWEDLYRAYGRECGDRTAAYRHTQAAFELLGLPAPARDLAPVKEGGQATRTRKRRGIRTPETAFYMPILQALEEMGGSGKTAQVIKRVGEFMGSQLNAEDRATLQSSGMPRWDNTARFARHSMVRNSLLRADSPWGIWEISEKGRAYLEAHRSG